MFHLKKLAMGVIAPALGLDRWDISTSGGDFHYRRWNVEAGEWESRGLPPDGSPDYSDWLTSARI